MSRTSGAGPSGSVAVTVKFSGLDATTVLLPGFARLGGLFDAVPASVADCSAILPPLLVNVCVTVSVWLAEAAFFCVVGVGFFMIHNSVQAEVADIDPSSRSTCFAMHAGFFYMGQTVGPLLWTLAIGALGPRGAIMLMGGALALTGLGASAAFRRLPKVASGAL